MVYIGIEKDALVKITHTVKALKIWHYILSKENIGGNARSINKEHVKQLLEIQIYGVYFKHQTSLPNIKLDLSIMWMQRNFLSTHAESNFCATQEHTLTTI